MLITDVIELSKSRSKVYLDYEFAFVLYKGELRTFKIKVGNTLHDEDYKEIMETILIKRAKLRAMNLLTAKEYSEQQLRRKLQDGYYPQLVIDIAIDYVKSYHYVDDYGYAKRYLEYMIEARSKKRIEMDLYKKGISSEIIKSVFEEMEDGIIVGNEEAMIAKLLVRKKYDKDNMDKKDQVKIQQFLLRKGFSYDVIRKSMDSFGVEVTAPSDLIGKYLQ